MYRIIPSPQAQGATPPSMSILAPTVSPFRLHYPMSPSRDDPCIATVSQGVCRLRVELSQLYVYATSAW